MSDLKEGWYWVQITPQISADDSGWEALKYEGGFWFMAGRADYLPEGLIFSVGPRILTPDEIEGWQVVPKILTSEMAEYARENHEGDHYLPYSIWNSFLDAAPKPGDV